VFVLKFGAQENDDDTGINFDELSSRGVCHKAANAEILRGCGVLDRATRMLFNGYLAQQILRKRTQWL
jgi:hypothetical protein